MATIRDVARLAGVSIATVSAALNDSGPVSREARGRIQAAIAESGYAPHAIARSLRTGRTRLLGLVVSDIANPFFASLARAVETAADLAGYSVVVANTDEDPVRELRLLKLMQGQRVAGVILAPSGFDAAYARTLGGFAGMPMVCVDRTVAGLDLDAVVTDNPRAARLAAEHLLGLGHRRIAIVGGRAGVSTADERLEGFRAALAEHGVALAPPHVRTADFRIDLAYETVGALLAEPAPPTAIFATNNLMALGAMQAVLDRDLSCPSGVSIAGIDDFAWSTTLRPRLTTVRQPIEEMGRAAVAFLLERAEGRVAGPARRLVLAPELVVRESSGPAPA